TAGSAGQLSRAPGISPGGTSTSSSAELPGPSHRVVWNAVSGKDEDQLVRGAAGEPVHRASKRATLFAPGAGAPTRRRQRKVGSSSSIAARGLDVPRQRVPPGAQRTRATPTRAGATLGRTSTSSSTPHSDRKSTRLNSSHVKISYAVFCLKK